jgi:hydroxyacylglutathione hydrolase
MVQISQLILGETGCVSYIIYCKKEAVIVDSFQGFEMIVEKELKKLHNPQIKYVIDTHTHADRRSASPYFSKKYGTPGIVKSNKTKYKGKRIGTNDEDILKIGTSNILVLFTPGHTYDHNCYLIDGKNLLSGDCLFIGDVGRIDLGGNLKEKSDLLFNSLRTLEKLPKNTRVYPNHVGAAHAIDSEDTFSTIGNEIETNEAMQIKDNDEFYTYMTEGWPPKPDDWEQIIEDNLNG